MTRVLAREFGAVKWNDPNWVVMLAEAFVQRYLHALDVFDQGASPGVAWQKTFLAITSVRTSVLEDLACGMAAHIIHDLPLALCDVGIEGVNGGSHIRDYHSVNDVLGDAIEPILQEITERYDPWLRWLEIFGRRFEEILTSYGIRLGRAVAWYNAQRLLNPASRVPAMDALERSPQVFVDTIFDPPIWSLQFVVRLVDRIISLGRRWPRA